MKVTGYSPEEYSPEEIEYNKRYYWETALKKGTAKRTSALLSEAAEIISQLQKQLAEARKQLAEARNQTV